MKNDLRPFKDLREHPDLDILFSGEMVHSDWHA